MSLEIYLHFTEYFIEALSLLLSVVGFLYNIFPPRKQRLCWEKYYLLTYLQYHTFYQIN